MSAGLPWKREKLEVEGQMDSLAYSSNEAYRKAGAVHSGPALWLMAAVCREARLLLQRIAVGAVLMDGVRSHPALVPVLVPHRSLAVGLEDFCYWIWAGFFTFLFLYRENDGALRFILSDPFLYPCFL